MKVACLAILDNGNFMRHAARGLRDYCGVDATAYHQWPDQYLHIPDPTVHPWDGTLDTDDYDAIITNDHTYHHYHPQLKDVPRLVKCNGTWARQHAAWFYWDHIKHDTLYLTSPTDYTLARALPFSVQTLPPLIDARLLPAPAFDSEIIRVGHAPTSPHKGTNTILTALKPYKDTGTIEIDVITDTPWTDCLARKAQCHLFIDQVCTPWRGAFGTNAVESLALGSVVLNEPLHPYVRHHIPDIPIYPFPEYLHTAITALTDHDYISYALQWVKEHFDLSTHAPRLHDWLQEVIHHEN